MSDDEDDASRYTAEDVKRIAAKWMDRIKHAEKREEQWARDAETAETAYLCDTGETARGSVPEYNILHSNIETVVPAIYNSTPSPDIRPRHANTDPAAKQVADALERAISTQIDDDKLTPEIEALAQDACLAGRGITRIRFDASVSEDEVTGERVVFENVSWRDYREGPAKRWEQVPWVAYRHCVSQQEIDRLTDESLPRGDTQEPGYTDDVDADIWEVWCKETRKVYFIAADKERLLSVRDDPLGLAGFFPQPRPVQPITGTGRRQPVCPYTVYKRLAEEMDTATRRIAAITKALKVRAAFAGNAENIVELAEADDNEIVPLPDAEGVLALGGLDRAIMWWPVDTMIAVLQQLYQQRDMAKAAIYECTGLADIIRGASDPRETAAAQELKGQWGSQRIKRLQRMIQSHIRDLFNIAAEVMVRHFTPEGLQRAAGMQLDGQALQMVGRALDIYRIDVETDSTIRADQTRDRAEMSEFMQGSAAFFQVMAPIIEQNPAAAVPAAEIYRSFARTYNLGKSAEDAIEAMTQQAVKQAQQGAQESPEKEAKRAEAQVKMQELQLRGEELKLKARDMQQRGAMDAQKAQADLFLKKMEIQIKAQQLGLDADIVGLEREKARIDAMLKVQELQLEATQARPVAIGQE